MPFKVSPATEILELSAAVEVSKSLALNALLIAFTAGGGASPVIFESLKEQMLAVFKNATVNLPEAEAARFRSYAEAAIEELFGRLIVNDTPMRPLSS